MPSMVTRPVITSMANAIRLHWRRVVAVTWGWKQWKSATISTIGALRCGVGVVVLYNATLHDNGPPYLIFGEGIDGKTRQSNKKEISSYELTSWFSEWSCGGSNPGPHDCQSCALPSELQPQSLIGENQEY